MAIKQQMQPVFISFASSDHSIAAELANKLAERQLGSFFAPRDIAAGENFALRIVEAIVECNIVIVLLSASAISSPHVRREVSLAIDERRQLIPVALPGTRFPQDFTPEWSYWLSAVQVLEFTTLDDVIDVLTVESAVPVAATAYEPRTFSVPTSSPDLEARNPISPVSLLRPEYAVVPFAGRTDDLARLLSWLDRRETASVRLVTAPGGYGKSRLAQELVTQAGEGGWDAAFVRDVRTLVPSVLTPTLWVVDYAETKGSELAEAIQKLSLTHLKLPVRLLLLARSAGDWWRALSDANADAETLLANAVVQELAPLSRDPETAAELYGKAIHSFANALGVPPPDANPPAQLGDSFVDLLQRALLAVLAGSQNDDSERVIRRLLGHERRYVRVAASAAGLQHFDDIDFDRAVGLFSLFPPRNETEAVELASIAQPDGRLHDHRRLARLLRRVYPEPEGYSNGLKPDVVAELAIAGLLEEDRTIPGGLETWVLIDEARFATGLRILARVAASTALARTELQQVIGASGLSRLPIALDVALQVESPEGIASALRSAIVAGHFDTDLQGALELLPEETVALSEVGAILTDRLMVQSNVPSDSPLAMGLRLLEASNRFSDAGWTVKALNAVSEGIVELRKDTSEPSQVELGRALSNLSNRLWESGSLDVTLAPAAEAVELLASRADHFAVLGARNNLAFQLIEAGRYDDARMQCDLALEIIGNRVPETGPLRPCALAVRNNLVCLDAAIGAWGRAAEQAAILIAHRRSDYATHRDRHLAYLARALANAAIPFAAAGDTKLASMAIAEARVLHRMTAARAPIFAFEAAESALIEAVVGAVTGSSDSAGALSDALRILGSIGTNVGALSCRLERSIRAVGACLAARGRMSFAELTAVGTAAGPDLCFPILLEYKDL